MYFIIIFLFCSMKFCLQDGKLVGDMLLHIDSVSFFILSHVKRIECHSIVAQLTIGKRSVFQGKYLLGLQKSQTL